MGRTRLEIEAVASKITDNLRSAYEKRRKFVRSEAKQVIQKEVTPLLKQQATINKKIDTKVKNLGLRVSYASERTEEYLVNELVNNLAGVKRVDYNTIEREVILSGNQGSDILIQKITEKYL